MLDLSQLLHVPHVDSGFKFDISPDGQRLVFAWNKTGRWELHEIDNSGVRQLAVGAGASSLTLEGSKSSPKFSPDGTMLAYALDIDGSESYHIVVHDLSTNISIDLTPRIAYAHQPNF